MKGPAGSASWVDFQVGWNACLRLLGPLVEIVDRDLGYFRGYVAEDQISRDDVLLARHALAAARGRA